MAETKSSEITSRPPLVDVSGDRGTPPGIVYIGRDDRLYVRSASLSSAPSFQLAGRLLDADGVIRPFRFTIVSGATAFADVAHQLAEGFLLALTAHGTSDVTSVNQVWVEAGILRGRLADRQIGQVFFRGYLSPGSSLGWPPGRLGGVLEAPGRPGNGTGPDPAAGAEASITVTTNVVNQFSTFRVTLVTDATVADRQVAIELASSGGVVVWRSEKFAAHPASTSRTYNWSAGGEFTSAVNLGEHHGYIPLVKLTGGEIIRTATTLLQAGDNYGAPTFHRSDWFSG